MIPAPLRSPKPRLFADLASRVSPVAWDAIVDPEASQEPQEEDR